MSDRYAEGTKEAADCQKCGQPIWRVYHGPHANHTIEPRAEDARSLEDQLATLRSEVAYVRGHLEGYVDALELGRFDDDDRSDEPLILALREDSERLGKLGGSE